MTSGIIRSDNVLMSTSIGFITIHRGGGQYAQVHYESYNLVHPSNSDLPQREDRYCNSLLWQFKIMWNVDVLMWGKPTAHMYTRSTH